MNKQCIEIPEMSTRDLSGPLHWCKAYAVVIHLYACFLYYYREIYNNNNNVKVNDLANAINRDRVNRKGKVYLLLSQWQI